MKLHVKKACKLVIDFVKFHIFHDQCHKFSTELQYKVEQYVSQLNNTKWGTFGGFEVKKITLK